MRWLLAIGLVAGLGAAGCMPPSWSAAALLHPNRRHVTRSPSLRHREVAFESDGLVLRGWSFPGTPPARGVTVVVLHGIADNRESALWIAERLVPKRFDVLAYDSRAHGESGGEACSHGFHEKRDLSRGLDRLAIHSVMLVGNSLGAGSLASQSRHRPSSPAGQPDSRGGPVPPPTVFRLYRR